MTFSFVIDCFPAYTKFNKKKKVMATLQIIDATDAAHNYADKSVVGHLKRTNDDEAYSDAVYDKSVFSQLEFVDCVADLAATKAATGVDGGSYLGKNFSDFVSDDVKFIQDGLDIAIVGGTFAPLEGVLATWFTDPSGFGADAAALDTYDAVLPIVFKSDAVAERHHKATADGSVEWTAFADASATASPTGDALGTLSYVLALKPGSHTTEIEVKDATGETTVYTIHYTL